MTLRHVIIGAGAAGFAGLAAIRRRDPNAQVSILWDEPVRPYARMALHNFVAGQLGAHDLFRTDDGLLDHPATQALAGRRAERLDVGSRQVILDDGAALPYDRLLIATGAAPNVPPLPGLDGIGAKAMWTYRDAQEILARATSASRVVVLGAGFVGLQAAQALAKGRRVTIVEATGQVLPRMLDRDGAAIVRRLLALQGIAVILGECAVEVATAADSGQSVLTLAGGGELRADLTIVATGARPRLEFLAGTPLATAEGIVVDRGQRTALPDVFAAGDAARVAGLPGGEQSAVGIWPAAVAQGEVAGANMAGGDERYEGDVPMNVVHVGGVTVAALGLVNADGAQADSFGGAGETYRRFLWRDERLLGCVSIGPARDLGLLKELIASGAALPNGRAAVAAHLWDCSAPLLAAKLLPRP